MLAVLSVNAAGQAEDGKHLFILSGQSNMYHMDPKISFTPAVTKALGEANVTVVKNAKRGAPIRAWDKDYKWPADRPEPTGRKRPGKKEQKKEYGWLYDKLMESLKKHTAGKTYDTITFVWMQGETDGGQQLADRYTDSFKRLVTRLKSDLKVDSLNIVIGRLSDYGLGTKRKKEWVAMRELQVKLAEEDPNVEWVNTDDLNDKVKNGKMQNDLHYTKEGYKILGQRFAEKAIALIKKK